MIFLIIFAILIILLLFPLRVKVTIIYEDNEINVYVFNKLLNLSIFKNPANKEEKTQEEKVTPKSVKKSKQFINKLIDNCLKSDLFKGRFRPGVKFDCNVQYGFEDAAITGVGYGLLSNFSYTIYNLIERRLNIKKYQFNITPQFNNPMLKFRIISIIYLNLAQIIYVLITIYRK